MQLDAAYVEDLDVDRIEPGTTQRLRVVLGLDVHGMPMGVPVIVRRAAKPGPIVGLTAAIHGNEINGIRVMHRLFEACPTERLLCGTLVGVPVINVPGFLTNSREFHDGADLNRTMPGKIDGNGAQQFAYHFLNKIARTFQYHIDLHTASFGRVNTVYARANMKDPIPAKLARLMRPEIIVHCSGRDSTLRGAVSALGIPSVTLEVGDPQALQYVLIRQSRLGIQEVLEHLEMIPDLEDPEQREPIECTQSYWMHTDAGGILDVHPELGEQFAAGDIVARLTNVWGDEIRTYAAPEAGIVVGKSTNPVSRPGARILHLGRIGSV
ncbi:MAG TPA: succinylglutamate desuccinylase/aspartoacylase family protein [Kofleriaceae bacterium]|nr:succinylglutamate desuccinylase/aspartoacylase family protein [Kofleriaceae bacterium]